jgi:hypothetical protein
MPDRWTASLSVPPREALRFGAAAMGLGLLPLLPALLSPLPRGPYFPLCVEALVLLTAVVYTAGTRGARPVRLGALAGLGLLTLYQGYDAAVYTAFQRTGILYEDLHFVDNLTYLAFDIGSWRLAGGVGLALIGIGGAAWGAHRALRVVARGACYGGCRAVLLGVHLLAWPLVGVVGPAQDWGTPNLTYQTGREQVRMRTITTKAWANARASLRLHRMLDSLGTAPVDSTYFRYDALSLGRRPSIYLFAVESYGTVLDRHPALRGPYRRVLRRSAAALRADGWHAASGRLAAPVRGGRSWLAIASLLTGVRVDRQLLFNRFQADPSGTPHLVRFLDRQGYRTVALQPFTFERPGLPVRNLYGFDVTLYRDDLDYRGPPYGLADAPDQYSLRFAHDTELAPADEPFFLFFETVSSHALWNYGLPPVLADGRAFNAGEGPPRAQKARLDSLGTAPTEFLPDSVTAPRIYDQPTPQRYLQHVAYDLRVIRDYLIETAPPGSLVLLLGDHQPPLLNTASAATPLHVLSTDSTLVRRVRRYGLTAGMTPTDSSATLRQEGLYSMLVRLLAAHDRGAPPDGRADSTALPPYRPEGVSPSLLVR